jgi:hypothetical protein
MKSYFAVSFFIVCFLCTQALSGPARAPQQEAKCFYKKNNDETKYAAKINEIVTTKTAVNLCTQSDCDATVEKGKLYKCVGPNTWLEVIINSSGYYYLDGVWHKDGDPVEDKTLCALGEIRYNGDCISCEKLTGASNATTTSPTASNLYECYLPKDNEYMDDKGIFTYTANCDITCTDETQEYCTSA